MAWIVAIAFAVIAAAAVLVRGRPPAGGRGLVIGAAVLAATGYALQGTPALPAAPRAVHDARDAIDRDAVAMGQTLSTVVGSDGQWLALSDALIRQGQPQTAVVAMRSALTERRDSPDLWVGLGNALVAHSGGLVTPAALLAFRQAQRFAPDNPAAAFFVGLAAAQAGRSTVARAQWQQLLHNAPADAPWRRDVEARLNALDQPQ